MSDPFYLFYLLLFLANFILLVILCTDGIYMQSCISLVVIYFHMQLKKQKTDPPTFSIKGKPIKQKRFLPRGGVLTKPRLLRQDWPVGAV